jgi:predicted dehydrogenase
MKSPNRECCLENVGMSGVNDSVSSVFSRRELLKTTGRLAAASALAGVALPSVHAAGSEMIQVALIGCGGRGSGAAINALATQNGPIKLVAMAEIFANQLERSLVALKEKPEFSAKVDVPSDRQFVGFDAYKKAMDCLKPGDVAIFATPPAFRWVHFTYAIEKGLHVFMEKPLTVDGPTSKRMLGLAEAAAKKNLKVGVGLMSRHSRAMQELAKRVHDGKIGDIILQRGYRMHGPIGFFQSLPNPAGANELLYQVQRFHSFLWASGGSFGDFYSHVPDHLCWMKNSLPVKAQAIGGRHYRQSPEGITYVDQNFDVYSVEYTYADGSKFFFDGRCMSGCIDNFSSYLHGSKGSAIVSRTGDIGIPSGIYKGQNPTHSNMVWESTDKSNPYQNEWDDLMEAIRKDQPYNEVKRGVEASLVQCMGRMAAHTGQEITFEQILNCGHEFAPGLDQLTMDSPAPLKANPDGRYPVPQPGIIKDREY